MSSILLIGASGTGKSTSLFPNKDLNIIGLDPKETFIINTSKKELPFKGWKSKYKTFDKDNKDGNILFSDDSKVIYQCMKFVNDNRPEIKNLIIEDTNLSSSKTFFGRAGEGGFQMWNDIGQDLGNIILMKDKLREDLNTIYIFHTQDQENAMGKVETKVKTLGKLVDNYIDIPSKFTVVLHAVNDFNPITNKNERWFYNNDYPGSPCKSPFGMFEENKTINDLGLVLNKIKEYEECEDC
jgi:hypothetical protein